MKDKPAVTIKDVAQHAGVSTATVSRVLSGSGPVRPELREHVLRSIRSLNYRPSGMARNFRAQRSRYIGLIISDVENPFYTSLVRAVEGMAYGQQFRLLLCNSDEDPDREHAYLEFMADERVAGVIASPTHERNTSLHPLLEADIPVVAVDRRSLTTPVDTVLLDNESAAFELAQHLIQHGHRRIGAIVPSTCITSGKERLNGFLRALAHAGISFADELLQEGKGVESFGYTAALHLLGLPNRPSALFSGNNLITLGVLKAIRQLGLRIPDDVSIVAHDELPWMSLLAPGITVSAQPIYELGRCAAQMLFERINGSTEPIREVRLKSRLIVRESVAPPAVVSLASSPA